VNVRKIKAKSILRKYKKIDSWFVSRYGMNLYRGCIHNCVYCDGRTEKYNVLGEFGCDIDVKINAIEILNKELNPRNKRNPLRKEYIMLGGGVGDSYQPVEKEYKLTRKSLDLLYNYNFPVSILTKSTLVKRDIEIIKKINKKNRAIVSFSFSSADDKISKIFEPGVPPPSKRLEVMRLFKTNNIATGMFLMPVIPFITDKPDIIKDTIEKAKDVGVDFIIFSGMTLKEGRQKKYFLDVLKKVYPDLITEYHHIYKDNKWGNTITSYYESIHRTFSVISKKYKIPIRIPPYLFNDLLTENDLVKVILEQLDYILKIYNRKSPYRYAAYSISKIQKPLSEMKNNLRSIKGVGPTTERIILEILKTGSSSHYEKLLYWK